MLTKEQAVRIKSRIYKKNEKLPTVFSALSDPGRFRIMKLLILRKEVCVTDVAHILGVSLPAASKQLKIMEIAGLVKKERMGQMKCYELNRDNDIVKSIIKMV